MATRTLSINRAPVLTLWAAVVAQRLGFDEDEALTLGRAGAGLNAQPKGRRLGVFKPHEEEPKAAREKGPGEVFRREGGKEGWGAKGVLDVGLVEALAKEGKR